MVTLFMLIVINFIEWLYLMLITLLKDLCDLSLITFAYICLHLLAFL